MVIYSDNKLLKLSSRSDITFTFLDCFCSLDYKPYQLGCQMKCHYYPVEKHCCQVCSKSSRKRDCLDYKQLKLEQMLHWSNQRVAKCQAKNSSLNDERHCCYWKHCSSSFKEMNSSQDQTWDCSCSTQSIEAQHLFHRLRSQEYLVYNQVTDMEPSGQLVSNCYVKKYAFDHLLMSQDYNQLMLKLHDSSPLHMMDFGSYKQVCLHSCKHQSMQYQLTLVLHILANKQSTLDSDLPYQMDLLQV